MSAIIHFGLPKTGSTSIRHTVFSYFKATQGESFSYMGYRGPSSSPLIRMLYSDKTAMIRLAYEEGAGVTPAAAKAKAIDFLKEHLAGAREKTLFLSSEAIPMMDQANLENFLGYFSAAKVPFKGIGYVRSPKAFMESSFQQNVKVKKMRFQGTMPFPRYRIMLEKIIQAFGRKNAEFVHFDRNIFPNQCVVQDFIGRTGLNIPNKEIKFANDGLSKEAIALLYTYRHFASPKENELLSFNPGRYKVFTHMGTLRGEKLRFHSRFIKPLVEQNYEQILWTEDLLGASLTENLEADDAKAISTEEDLMVFAPETLEWLVAQIGNTPQSENVLSGNPDEVAKGMRLLVAKYIPGVAA